MPVATQWIDINTDDGQQFQGYLGIPRAGRGPAVLIVQEIFGVNPHIQSVVEQYALDGYVALAPDLFWRHEPRLELRYVEPDRSKALALLKQTDVSLALSDLEAAAKTLRARSEIDGKLASIGFCFGGLLSYLLAARHSVDMAVSYYGGGIQNKLDELHNIAVPLQMHFGENDTSIPLAAVEHIQQACAEQPNVELHRYPGAGHGFNCTDRASYDQRAAVEARSRTLAFLAANA